MGDTFYLSIHRNIVIMADTEAPVAEAAPAAKAPKAAKAAKAPKAKKAAAKKPLAHPPYAAMITAAIKKLAPSSFPPRSQRQRSLQPRRLRSLQPRRPRSLLLRRLRPRSQLPRKLPSPR